GRIRVEATERACLVEAPREEYRQCDFVQLDAAPIRSAVDPGVLGEPAVRLLVDGEVDASSKWGVQISCGQQRGGAMDHVPGPDKVIPALVVVSLRFSPRDREGRDDGPGVVLVLVRQEDAEAAVKELPAVIRSILQGEQSSARSLP